MDRRNKRIMKDLCDFYLETTPAGLGVKSYSDDLSTIKLEIVGLPATPFEGGKFELELGIPEDFPFNPPKMNCRTPLWHPNVCRKTGRVCVDFIDTRNWISGRTLIDCAEGFRSLLSDPNPDSPLNFNAAEFMDTNKALYDANAALWSKVHAKGTSVVTHDLEELKGVLMGLELTEDKALLHGALSMWNIEELVRTMRL